MELRVALQVWLERIPEFTLADPAAVTWAAGQVRGPRTLPLRLTLGNSTLTLRSQTNGGLMSQPPVSGNGQDEQLSDPAGAAGLDRLARLGG
jgi:hypothetical protein